jgi:hypothetical protein
MWAIGRTVLSPLWAVGVAVTSKRAELQPHNTPLCRNATLTCALQPTHTGNVPSLPLQAPRGNHCVQ